MCIRARVSVLVCVSLVCARHVINCVPVLLLPQVSGLPTNTEFLKRITQNEEFKQVSGSSTVTPAFLPPPVLLAVAAAVVALAAAVIPRGEEPPFSSLLALPWALGKLVFFPVLFHLKSVLPLPPVCRVRLTPPSSRGTRGSCWAQSLSGKACWPWLPWCSSRRRCGRLLLRRRRLLAGLG